MNSAYIDLVVAHRNHLRQLFTAHPVDELRGSRLFLTGCTGFVGYWILSAIDVLNEAGYDIRAQALSRNPAGLFERHPIFRENRWLEVCGGDVESFDAPNNGFDLLMHGSVAFQTGMRSRDDALGYLAGVGPSTRRILEYALDRGVQRALLLSNRDVYADHGDPIAPISEADGTFGHRLGSNVTPRRVKQLGLSLAETVAWAVREEYGLDVVVARGFFFCGHGLPARDKLMDFFVEANEAPRLTVMSDGSAIRGYLYGADLAVWLLTMLVRGKPGCAYNVGSDEVSTLLRIGEKIRDRFAPGKPVLPLHIYPSPGLERSVPDLTRARKELGLEVWTKLDESIEWLSRSYLASRRES